MPTWLLALLNPGGLLDHVLSFIPNPEEKAKAQQAMQAALMQGFLDADKEQREINKTEAASASMFVAGWRPAVGWLCVVTLAYTWVLSPLISWVALMFNPHMPPLPVLNHDESTTLLYAMLGIGAYRTLDKAIPGGATQKILGMFSGKKS